MRSLAVKAAYGRKWNSRRDFLYDLTHGKDVLAFAGGYTTLKEMLAEGYSHVEAHQGPKVVAFEALANVVKMKPVEPSMTNPPKAELFPQSGPQVSEAEARQACQNARNLRKQLDRISGALARLDAKRRKATFDLKVAEGVVARWEAQETEIKKLGVRERGVRGMSAQRKEWELENRLRVALGLPPLAAGQEGLK